MKIKVKCPACLGGKRPMKYPEGGHCVCPYCKDTGKKEENVPDSSHKMSKWRSEVRCPDGVVVRPDIRECKICGNEEMKHPAGHFLDGLLGKCKGK